MNFKKIVFSLIMAVAFIAPNFANTNPIEGKTSKAIEEIQEMVKKIEFDRSTMSIKKAKVFFMVNSFNEVVVLQTSSEEIDGVIKNKLNYSEPLRY